MKFILKVLVGSRAHGLSTETSDFDYRGVFIIPTNEFFTLDGSKPREIHWVEGADHLDKAGYKQDDTAWEVGHFLRLALQCNPNVLEVFTSPIESPADITKEGEHLRQLFPYIWDPKKVYESYMGYAHNQRKKLFDTSPKEPLAKFATTYLRALIQGEGLLNQKALLCNLQYHDEFHTLQLIRNSFVTRGQVIDKCVEWEGRLEKAYKHRLAMNDQQQDVARIHQWLLELRQSHWK